MILILVLWEWCILLVSVNNKSDSQNPAKIDPSADEIQLLQKLRANPIMAERISLIVERFEQEVANGADANQAEMMVIDELRVLGKSMLQQWAEKSHQNVIEDAKNKAPILTHHGKKNSTGIPPSEI